MGFLPLQDPAAAADVLDEALADGVAAVWIPSDAPGDFSPAHVDVEAVWARLAEAGVPFVLHVGGGKLLPKAFHNNGRPLPKDWLGGGENLRSKDFPVLHHSPERFLACLALDGVFERHPGTAWRRNRAGSLVGAGTSSQCGPRLPVILPIGARPQVTALAALGVPATSGAIHAFFVRGHGLAHRTVRA